MCDVFDDPLFEQAIEWVVTQQKASVLGIQQNFRLGYNRASKMVEGMEEIGLVTPIIFNEKLGSYNRSTIARTLEEASALKLRYLKSLEVVPDMTNVIIFPRREPPSTRVMAYKELLKHATKLKRNGKFQEACEALYLAFNHYESSRYVDIRERLRLPAYLNFAGKPADAWKDLIKVKLERKDFFDQFAINWMIYSFHRDDGSYDAACKVLVAHHFRYLAHLRDSIATIEKSSDREACDDVMHEFNAFGTTNLPRTGKTPAGNPVYDVSYPHQIETFKREILLNSIQNVFADICVLRKNEPSVKIISFRIKREVVRGTSIIKADDIVERILRMP